MEAMSTSTSTATLISIEISTANKPSKTYRRGGSSIKRVRANGSTIRNTARVFRIETRGLRRNSTEPAPTMRSNHGNNFVDGPNKEDKISLREVPAIEGGWAGKVALAIAEVRSVTAAAPVNLGAVVALDQRIVEERVSLGAAEVAAALSRASIVAAARRVAPASVEAQAWEAAVEPRGLGVAAREVEGEEDDEDSVKNVEGRELSVHKDDIELKKVSVSVFSYDS